ncbi:Panacea domain-containing protein [Bradyrhizobium sp. Ash2021]|uniref:Panacea domain-containing protein n=1 Tax=Bradyrhizobium sp. Ash2021 TaxID=2954771 RepID=UPI00281695C9|nr:Panacea domain-containing protein [Bradyrhizobium sp. Ash2021]WMT75043.1 Panacea domain-containing protein [Bradyrhizobium sp. Ash2021]
MSSLPSARPKLTWKVPLPGGQRRLREAVLYVSQKCETAPFFGKVKLNKIIWRADFDSFAQRGQPVTGRQYQRLRQGPAPVEMLPVLNDLLAEGLLAIKLVPQGNHDEQRPVALEKPVLNLFSLQDLEYLDRAISIYWEKTGTEVSDISHGAAWKSREDGEPMPYELAYLSDEPLGRGQKAKLLKLATTYGWNSQ